MEATTYDEVKVYDVRSIDFVVKGTESLGNMLQVSNVSRFVLTADTFLEVHWSISLERTRRDDHFKRTLHDDEEKLTVIVTETQEIQSIIDTDDDLKLECVRDATPVAVYPDEDRYFALTRFSSASTRAQSTETVKSRTVLWLGVYDEGPGTAVQLHCDDEIIVSCDSMTDSKSMDQTENVNPSITDLTQSLRQLVERL